MTATMKLFRLKLRINLRAAGQIVIKPKYFLITAVSAFMTMGLILWSLNLGLVQYILFQAPVSLSTKISFFLSVYKDTLTNYSSGYAMGIALFSILFGINLSLLIYVMKNRGFKLIPKKSGLSGLAFAIIGGGCIACGASIIAPILATLGAASSSLVLQLGAIFNWLAIIFISYSIYKLGSMCAILLGKVRTQQYNELKG